MGDHKDINFCNWEKTCRKFRDVQFERLLNDNSGDALVITSIFILSLVLSNPFNSLLIPPVLVRCFLCFEFLFLLYKIMRQVRCAVCW